MTQRRPRQDFVARRSRTLALREAPGAGPVPLAFCGGRRGINRRGAAGIPAGGNRVAQPSADLAAVAGGLRAGSTIRMAHHD